MKIGVRDLVRNSRIFENHDYVDVEDKRSHTYKGLFVSPKYAAELKAYLDKKIQKEKRRKLADIMQFAGVENGSFADMSVQELTAGKRKRHEE